MNGVLEFYDTSDVVCMNQAEHFMATDVEWDPTGRFAATSVSWWAHKVRNVSQSLLYLSVAYPSFCSIRHMGAVPFTSAWDASPSQGPPLPIAFNLPVLIYSPGWVEALGGSKNIMPHIPAMAAQCSYLPMYSQLS